MKIKINKILMAMSLIVAILLSGCHKKNNDDSFVIDSLEEARGNIQNGTLANELGVPESINHQFDVSISGIEQVYISDETIYVPDVPAMYTMECSRIELDAEYRKQVAEGIFGDSAISVYDGQPTKAECEYCIEYYQKIKDCPDVAYSTIYSNMIEEYTDLKRKAPDIREKNTDFSSNQYIGIINNQQYLLTFKENAGYCSSVYLSLYPDISVYNFFDITEGFGAVESWGSLLDNETIYSDIMNQENLSDETAENNTCTYTEDEAVENAYSYLNCITDMPMLFAFTNPLFVAYFQGTTDNEYHINDGYDITFIPEVSGVKQYAAGLYYVDYMNSEYKNQSNMYDDTHGIVTNGTIFRVALASNGLVGIGCYMPMEKRSELEKANLLSWDEIVIALAASIDGYYTKHKTDYLQIRFNSIELSYYPKETDTGFIYIPVWVFAEIDEKINEPVQLIMLDAQTGDVVEIK